MSHSKKQIAQILEQVDLGSSVAESDNVLEAARVETSVFTDLLLDRVDLVPGTKGSGKTALYRIFIDFLREPLLAQRKVVIAHGVQSQGDSVFHAFNKQFEKLSEEEFVSFWCIYLVSLANEAFIKSEQYRKFLTGCRHEIDAFLHSCQAARIPEIKARKTLHDVLQWVLAVLPRPHPQFSVDPSDGKLTLDLFGEPPAVPPRGEAPGENTLPKYIHSVKDNLEAILDKADLSLWLMVDRLDEIFPRRTSMETQALRALLRTSQVFKTPHIRLKIFLRDDILAQITEGGFTALTHITARQSDKLTWSSDQILTLVVNRLFASQALRSYLDINQEQLKASQDYRREVFYKVFPPTVHARPNQSPTLRWIYTHTMDGKGVVTPRDVIDLLTRAKQQQIDEYNADPTGFTDTIIDSAAIRYGLAELSARKRDTYLHAEFPHFWKYIQLFEKGKTEYNEKALRALLGKDYRKIVDDLVGIGLLREAKSKEGQTYQIPFLYRQGLGLTQGRAD
jgi:hypothetical protein